MSSFQERLTNNKKRHRDQIALDDLHADAEPFASKRTCTATIFQEKDNLCLFEDICRVEEEPRCDAADSVALEELISEMMKNLEKVITDVGEESSLCQQGQCEINHTESWEAASPLSTPELLRLLSNEEQKGGDSSESEVDIKYLFEASDDELGIPPSPNAEGDKVGSLAEDVSWLDVSYAEFSDWGNLQLFTNTCDENWRYILALE